MQTLAPPKPQFDWKLFPETEKAYQAWISEALQAHLFASQLAQRMSSETGTKFENWVDHLVLADGRVTPRELKSLGYERDPLVVYPSHFPVYRHHGGLFPPVALAPSADTPIRVVELGVKVDLLADFCRAHDLGNEIEGYPMGPFRRTRLVGEGVSLAVVERRGYLGFDPWDGEMARAGRLAPHSSRDALAARERWHARKRRFTSDEMGFEALDILVEEVIELCHGSTDLACELIFESERAYWQSRNTAARTQKARQDRLGLGWANHDHHTFRCSRRHFRRVIRILERLGFFLRESFHAGAQAGWGAQVLEHPTTGIVIFADLDLAPEELEVDFAHSELPELLRPSTVGLWVGLHGESILEAGMHHLEAQFDFVALQQQLKQEANIATMAPFSNYSFLRQAFTEGERWLVSRARADHVLSLGWIDTHAHAQIVSGGAIGSHLENLERREGFKGFNQTGVSAILLETDPRKFLGH